MSEFCWIKLDEPIGRADSGLVVATEDCCPMLISAVGIDNVLVLLRATDGSVTEKGLPKAHIKWRLGSLLEPYNGQACRWSLLSDENNAKELSNYYRKRI